MGRQSGRLTSRRICEASGIALEPADIGQAHIGPSIARMVEMTKLAAIYSVVGDLVFQIASQIVHIHVAPAVEKRNCREHSGREA